MRIFILLFILPLPCLFFAQEVRYVDKGGIDGTTCADPDNPCLTISYALTQADFGDTIKLSQGVFTEPNGISIDKSIVLQGLGDSLTIIQAHEEPEMALGRVVTIDGAINVTIAGVTIRHGYANIAGVDSWGGGVFCNIASLVLEDVRMYKNAAEAFGGGLACYSSTATLSRVVFEENMSSLRGGGVYVVNSTGSFTHVLCKGNSASWIGLGGGAYFVGSLLTIDSSAFIQNDAQAGGGILFGTGSYLVSNSSVSDNRASIIGGGGAYIASDSLIMKNVLISGNIGESGGGLYLSQGYHDFSKVRVHSNISSSFGGGM